MAQVMHPQPGEPGRVTGRVPHLAAEPVGRDVPVRLPGSRCGRTILTGRSASSPVVSISTLAVLAAASRSVVGGEGPVPVPSAAGVRVGQACCLDDARAMPGRLPIRGLVAEQQVIRSQAAGLDVGYELGRDLGPPTESPKARAWAARGSLRSPPMRTAPSGSAALPPAASAAPSPSDQSGAALRHQPHRARTPTPPLARTVRASGPAGLQPRPPAALGRADQGHRVARGGGLPGRSPGAGRGHPHLTGPEGARRLAGGPGWQPVRRTERRAWRSGRWMHRPRARSRSGNGDVHPQCGRELCALARVNMSGSREPSRSSDDDFPRGMVTSPPVGGSGFVSMACLRRSSEIRKPDRRSKHQARYSGRFRPGRGTVLHAAVAIVSRHSRGEVCGSTRPAPDGRSPYRPAEAATRPPPRRCRPGARPNRP